MNIGWILLTVLMIGVLIIVHEAGHLAVAKLLKFPVHEFSVGMGPALFKRVKNGTQYSLRLLPLGGYVSFFDASDPVQEEVTVQKHPVGHRFWVYLAGAAMNLITAVLIAALVLTCWGVTVNIPRVEEVAAGSPAQLAGLQPGDDVISVNGVSVEGDFEAFRAAVESSGDRTMAVELRRGGETLTAQITPRLDAQQNRYLIGVTMGYEYRRVPLFEAIGQALQWTGAMIGQLFSFIGGLFAGKGTDEVSSVVGAVSVIATTGKEYGMASFLTMVAYLSINLGVMNLLPIPALDGGKILFLGLEKLRGRPISPNKEGILTVIFMGIFLVLFVILAFRDVMTLFGG